jgi:hypothetical protein
VHALDNVDKSEWDWVGSEHKTKSPSQSWTLTDGNLTAKVLSSEDAQQHQNTFNVTVIKSTQTT